MMTPLLVSMSLLLFVATSYSQQQLSKEDTAAYQNSCRSVLMTLRIREMHREPDDPPAGNDEFSQAGQGCDRLRRALSSGVTDDAARAVRELRPILALLGLPPTSVKEQFTAVEHKATNLSGDALFDALPDLARRAFNAGENEKAEHYATQLLQIAAQHPKSWNYGNAIFYGNFVLGRIELQRGDVKHASTYLLASGRTPGSPQLDSFGPNMTLAKELLDKGESDVVLQYLSLCRKFWEDGQQELDQWAADIRNHRTPDFSQNLNY